jgi:hypothetical protein
MHDVGREQSETARGQVYLTQTSRLMEASLLWSRVALRAQVGYSGDHETG